MMHLNFSPCPASGWLLRVKLGPAWEQCFFTSSGEALEAANALCEDYGAEVKELKMVRVDDPGSEPLVRYQKYYRN
jgi:hypothetical protein